VTIVATTLLALGAVFSLTRFATPALALGAGIAIALSLGNPWRHVTGKVSGRLLQASVVGLGFGIPLEHWFAPDSAALVLRNHDRDSFRHRAGVGTPGSR